MAQVEAFLAEQDPVEEEEDEAAEEAAPRRGGGGGGSGLSEAMQAFLGEDSLPRPQARRCCHALKALSARLFRSHAIKLPCEHAPAAWKPCADIAACQLQVVKRLWEYIKANDLQVCRKQQNRLTKTQGFMHALLATDSKVSQASAMGTQDPKNKRKIIPDERLGTILTPPVDIFSMNKQLSKHCWAVEGASSQFGRVCTHHVCLQCRR